MAQQLRIHRLHVLVLGLVAAAAPVFPADAAGLGAEGGASVYMTAPDEPHAVTVHGVGDGKADDTAAIQSAIDEAAKNSLGGIVFIPSGRYRISRTLLVPLAVRIFGVGASRPVIYLGDKTPGFQKGIANLVVFTGGDIYTTGKVPVPVPTVVPYSDKVRDANSSTFYSALGNVDFEIGDRNPAAVAVRFRTAQHTFLSHIDFRLGSGLAGIYQAGNEAEDLHFYGGRYGILTEKTSPAWQFTLIDSTFVGQREAAIREHEADLTLVNVQIKNTPVGIDIDRGYSDSLWGKDVRFENVSKAAVIISNERAPFTQIGFDNATAANVPVFAHFRDSGKEVAGPAKIYSMRTFTYGLKVTQPGTVGTLALDVQATPLKALPTTVGPAIRSLPGVDKWVNVRTLGVVGDGKTDDTAAIQKAIDEHRVVYFPAGCYVVTNTITLRPDTVLIAMHPSLTQLVIPDGTPAFSGAGDAKALLQSASGGNAIVSGIGLSTGDVNPRATALLWKAGADSLVDDVKIQGGHGTLQANGVRLDPYAKTPGMPDPRTLWDRQRPSIWVTDGGGGTFANIWSPNTVSQAGFYVTNTKTPGHVYELSAEHHVRAEIVLDGVENWEFLAPQTEEEVRESQDTVSTEIRNSRNILFANYHGYRVTRTVKPASPAIKIFNSDDIRLRNVHVNGESGFATCDDNGCTTYLRASKFPFDDVVEDVTHKQVVREREFAVLDISSHASAASQGPAMPKVEKLEGGFYSITGAATDSKGQLYFVEHQFQRIYRWSKSGGLELVSDAPLDPVNLAFDKSDNLLVLSSMGAEGTVYSFKPGTPGAPVTVIAPTPVVAHKDAFTALPGNYWNNGEFRDQLDPNTMEFTTLSEMYARDAGKSQTREYVSPDGSLVLPAFRVLTQGPADHTGYRWSDTLQAFGLVKAKLGERVFVSNGSEAKVYSAVVGEGGSLTHLTPLTHRGGESVAVDRSGNLYVANGQIFVYGPDGQETGRIDVPERPLQLVFGGVNGTTLFILTHHSLYAVEP
ncbi:glycosyl hydrolase family 28-related protein [Asticcacaulis sp. 201]|uniref:glycosyl hydrolase family 28-related protein n=1 Tax=Asticcacaulis sp. 201 TaxID=3028787 RepID=UPI00291708F6|nr:glycosyl hydrolase family 28-related protein [Asticcacaulis sp. 201]MDV6333059.1 glycosyl hydrolase family 28-related protein [Asticcacaulis sp. 201]